MSEILPGVHQVEGVDPSPDFTTHVYLVEDRTRGWTLVDTGLPSAYNAIVAYLKKIGVPPTDVKQILITHLHNDHTGTLERLAQLTHAKTYAHWVEAPYIAGNPRYDGPGHPPEHPTKVSNTFKDGDELPFGGDLVAYHTPGHTPGSATYYSPSTKVAFCGDLFMGIPKLGLTVPEYTQHTLTAQISARRVAALGAESILCHHGGPFLKGAGAELNALVRSF
ncbi:MAG TPA: MBL fold metallo-hydrolase [Thermoplasmata archaeon]|nr:MBL fold metallo-hydrolase [Thermoplasmata archaeon]HEV2429418.1 MBL fold metallo-hydrolase [Thermoplasmata archaeon]